MFFVALQKFFRIIKDIVREYRFNIVVTETIPPINKTLILARTRFEGFCFYTHGKRRNTPNSL